MVRTVIDATTRGARRIVVAVIGATVLGVGVAMILLPGPALIVIPAGLAILGLEFAWARRMLKRVRAHAETTLGARRKTGQASRSSATRSADEAA